MQFIQSKFSLISESTILQIIITRRNAEHLEGRA